MTEEENKANTINTAPVQQDIVNFDPSEQPDQKLSKKKIVLMLSYSGKGYHGMQINPNVKTIEGDLITALTKSGAISELNTQDIRKIDFNRCARTDKGVHALSQLVSFKMLLNDDIDGLIEKINENLPGQIRVWGVKRCSKAFNAKNMCDGRIYEYVMPTFVFKEFNEKEMVRINRELKEEDFDVLRNNFNGKTQKREIVGKNGEEGEAQEELEGTDDLDEEIITKKEETMTQEELDYRMTEEQYSRLSSIVQQYVGTHNFHNYTVGRSVWDKSCKRTMRCFVADKPFVRFGREWIALRVTGQSFMLHQIRKMVGMAILLMRAKLDPSFITKTFQAVRLNIPKAPALGLFLVQPLFDSYNKLIEKTALTQPHSKAEKIDFDLYKDNIEKFKVDWIHKTIFESEVEENQFKNWMGCAFNGENEYLYLRSGEIPEIYKELANIGTYDPKRVEKKPKLGSKRKRIGEEQKKENEEAK